MNQILITENNYNKQNKHQKKESYKPRKPMRTEGNGLLDMRKIVVTFSVIIILFAVIIVSTQVIVMIKERESKKDTPVAALNKPTITIEKIENTCKIQIVYDEGLDKTRYWWNDDTNLVVENNMNGSTESKRTLQIPDGDNNILHVTATGIDGSFNEASYSFGENTENLDSNKPKIDTYFYGETNQIDIIAKSAKGIKEITYNWNDETEVTVTNTTNNQNEFKITIEGRRGTNKLQYKATDLEGNVQEKEQNIVGVLSPEIKFEIQNGNILNINIKHDKGFKKVIITLNGMESVYDENNPLYSQLTKELNFSVEVPAGPLQVQATVYTLEEPDKAYQEIGTATIQ